MAQTLTLLLGQTIQMFLVLMVAPGITGITRRAKARFMRRQGAPIIQPYRDLIKLVRKEISHSRKRLVALSLRTLCHSGLHLGGSSFGSDFCFGPDV